MASIEITEELIDEVSRLLRDIRIKKKPTELYIKALADGKICNFKLTTSPQMIAQIKKMEV